MSETSVSGEERAQWRRNITDAWITNRGSLHYNAVFDVNSADKILDIGPGLSKFSYPQSVGIDVIFANSALPKCNRTNVAGIFQDLPFRDECFDQVVASYAFWWVRQGRRQSLEEVFRVLKPDGKLQIHPGYRRSMDYAKPLEEAGVTQLERLHGSLGSAVMLLATTNAYAFTRSTLTIDKAAMTTAGLSYKEAAAEIDSAYYFLKPEYAEAPNSPYQNY